MERIISKIQIIASAKLHHSAIIEPTFLHHSAIIKPAFLHHSAIYSPLLSIQSMMPRSQPRTLTLSLSPCEAPE